MSTEVLYPYPTLIPGVLRRRYKRFFADVELEDGSLVTAHCANTGPMTGISKVDSPVYLSPQTNPQRKLAYTWELIQVSDQEPTWVNVNTALPNRLLGHLLREHRIPELAGYQAVQPEVVYGQEGSRIDFRLTGGERPIYVEIKNTTWAAGRRALFPDTVTTRGQKHIRELMTLVPDARALLLYCISRGDCTQFSPGDQADPEYGRLLRQALDLGVEVLPCRFQFEPTGITYLGPAELVLSPTVP
ncbi:MAG: DNA/RNA nuclease SfsA [Gloeomargaritaceae cyanobacterium C42_A2020_066]|nr:DNA/RNA nuclease SfsA [Gloeomargaritaceae cyanobacterium C42_A2020_066]